MNCPQSYMTDMKFIHFEKQGAVVFAAQFIPDMLAVGSKEWRIWKTLDVCAVKQLHMCTGDDLSPLFVPFSSRYKFFWQEVESAMAVDDNTITEPITILQYCWPFDRANIGRPPLFFFLQSAAGIRRFFLWLWIHQWSFHNSIKHPNRQELQTR